MREPIVEHTLPMEREDYVLRMIAATARVLAHVRRLLLHGKYADAGEQLEQVSVRGGLDLRFVITLDEASLRPMLYTGGEIDRPKCAFFAEVVYLEWRRQLAMGALDYATRCATRALLLFALAYDGIVVEPETRDRIAELEVYFEPTAPRQEGA